MVDVQLPHLIAGGYPFFQTQIWHHKWICDIDILQLCNSIWNNHGSHMEVYPFHPCSGNIIFHSGLVRFSNQNQRFLHDNLTDWYRLLWQSRCLMMFDSKFERLNMKRHVRQRSTLKAIWPTMEVELLGPSCQADSENPNPQVLQSIPSRWSREGPRSAIHEIDRADAAKTTPYPTGVEWCGPRWERGKGGHPAVLLMICWWLDVYFIK